MGFEYRTKHMPRYLRVLLKAAKRITVPRFSKGNIQANFVTISHQAAPQLGTNPEQHLKLESRSVELELPDQSACTINEDGIVRGDADIRAMIEH